MARKPKAPPLPASRRRGRKAKAAEPMGFAPAEEGGTESLEAVEAEAAVVTPVEKPARRKPGPKPKQRPEPAMPTLSGADERQPAMDLDQPHDLAEPTLDRDDTMVAEMAFPVSANDGAMPEARDAGVEGAPRPASQGVSEQAEPAARWDRATDTVEFNWPKIERTAAQDGPNQVMAKLLVAARAEGANSRWPL